MIAIARAAAFLIVAAVCFAAAVFFGVKGANAQTAVAGTGPVVCCIYMIF